MVVACKEGHWQNGKRILLSDQRGGDVALLTEELPSWLSEDSDRYDKNDVFRKKLSQYYVNTN